MLGAMTLNLGSNADFILGEKAHIEYHAALHGNKTTNDRTTAVQAHGNLFIPVFSHPTTPNTDKSQPAPEISGLISGIFGYDALLVDILPNGIRGVRVVIVNNCNHSFTYELDGNEVRLRGHDNG